MIFSVAEFPDHATVTDLDEQVTMKCLKPSSIPYSACSSFTALSGNSDLQLHSTRQRASEQERNKSSVQQPIGESSKKGEDGEIENVHEKSKEEPKRDDKDEQETHREPIGHLLKVKIHENTPIRHALHIFL